MVSTKTSIKSLATVALFSITAFIAGCGGGGATDPFAVPPAVVIPPLVVNPGTLNIYSGTPAVVTISSGVGPFQVFTSDAVVLPVTQVVGGAAITLTANAVAQDAVITLTVQDAAAQRVAVTVTVKPSPLIGALTITPTTNTTCAGASASVVNQAAICSSESGVVSVTLRSNATSVLANRQVRFDVIQGAYNFVIDQAGTVLAKTVTILTDQNGKADAVIRMDAGAPSQAALIRATDTTSGNRVDSSFTIVQAINGTAVLSVVPKEWIATGFFAAECPGGSGDYIIYGGRAPYTITNNLPNAFTLSSGGVSSSTSVTVAQSGGRFTASHVYSQNCVGYDATFVITDASGLATTAAYSVKPGSAARTATTIAPTAVTLNAVGKVAAVVGPPAVAANPGTCANRTVNFAGATGVGPLTWSLSVPPSVATLSSFISGVTVTTGPGFLGGEIITVIAIDSANKLSTATISCS